MYQVVEGFVRHLTVNADMLHAGIHDFVEPLLFRFVCKLILWARLHALLQVGLGSQVFEPLLDILRPTKQS